MRESAAARAFLATIVNPKALTVYLVVVPGVAVSLGQSLRTVGVVFAVTHIICTFGWLAAVDCLIQRARWLGQPRSRRALQLAAAGAGLVVSPARSCCLTAGRRLTHRQPVRLPGQRAPVTWLPSGSSRASSSPGSARRRGRRRSARAT